MADEKKQIDVGDVTITWEDYYRASQLAIRLHPYARVISYALNVFWFLVILGAILYLSSDYTSLVWILVALVLVGGWLAWRYIGFPRQVRKIYDQDTDLNLPCTLEASDEGVRATNMSGTHLRRWSDIVKWREDAHLLLLFLSDVKFFILPKREIADSGLYSTIKDELSDHEVPEFKGRWVGTAIWLGITIIMFWLVVPSVFLWLISWIVLK